MSYSKLLKNIIDSSELSYKEVAEKCKANGKAIDPSYISKLVNNKISPPKDDISKAIASVCNGDSESLILEAYLEKAPQSIIKMFDKLRNMLIDITLNLIPEEQKELVIEIFKTMPLFTLLDSMTNETNNNLFSITENKSEIGISIKAFDDGMNPLIRENQNALISQKKSYENGDIIALTYIKSEDENIIFRKFYSLPNSNVLLIALNPSYNPIIIDKKEFIIVGYVTNVII
ncbi:MAG: LexA family transcriptional regulator [Clostridiales bacterium]|nr:LexA family transcriptional regulator [Clostridiales bacterium]